MRITTIQRKRDLHKKRVAAYARVSTTLSEQSESYEEQREYYERIIKANPEYEFAGVYSDEMSGLDAKHRTGFQQMVDDALAQKIDMILCKSVSRWSRNILDAQTYCELLQGNGVTVVFEKENISTDDPSSSMMFGFMATVAEDESQGEYKAGNHITGYKTVDGKLVPDEQADTVRLMFEMYRDGAQLSEVAKVAAEHGVCAKNGKPLSYAGIKYIFRNEVYKGDRRLQKQPPRDYLTKKAMRGDYKTNYLVADHEPIVSTELWDAVQERLGTTAHGNRHFLYGHVVCGECHCLMTRRTLSARGGVKYKAWMCSDRLKGKHGNGCQCRIVREDEVFSMLADQSGVEIVPQNAAAIGTLEVRAS